ncbi:P-loop containing nucleoside triphosphate hydrolase protein [Dacryopinax primogenitus]|uniref:p-loop containing nucleoside triphosphate hydrolase protein n=1 Tax=Dacryopinax primogenitus (strain DJM 731) TaxID=1858805 RepID=M5FUP0_DACPD|nr:P-loop containing nucleoside triphosphate hydrolase protein [Dacryopinax primogenitus]EJT99973.1 P-loop containing nucleoside triphosphate hydrolase protein [Dacryopinax primogenitus]
MQAKRARTNGSQRNGHGSQRQNPRKRQQEVEEEMSEGEAEGDGDYEDIFPNGTDRRGKKNTRLTDEQLQQIKEDKEFEEEMEPKIQDAIFNRPKRQGDIAEMGIIQSLELINFMCHKNLKFHFGPQINFIIGHNGSGKSAILTALTVALGGKAMATSRASSLKTLIKEGEPAAEVTVVLKNKGPEAFNYDIYGDYISITRRLTMEGSTSYKIKGAKSDKTISSKRDELTAICDHMNIQVDNPMNVLTQDTARQFLSASKPKDKYAFFLRGTQLLQLSLEYELIRENNNRMGQVIGQKKEVIPELEKEADEARNRFQEAEKARDQRNRLDTLMEEKAWSIIFDKEKVSLMNRSAGISPDLVGFQEVKKHKERVEGAERVLPKLSTEFETADEVAPLEEKRTRVHGAVRNKKQEIMQITNDEKEMNGEKKRIDQVILELKQQLEEETRKLREDTREQHEAAQARLHVVREKLEEARTVVAEHARHHDELRNQHRKTKEELKEAEREREDVKKAIQESQNVITHMQKTKTNSMQGYGNKIPELLELIKQESNWFGQPPLGPFGMYVDAKQNAGQFVPVLKVILGHMMRGFVLTDARDRTKLKRLLDETNNRDTQIVISERDIFEYAHAEPPPEILTFLRVLDFKDEWVKRIFINSHRIETTLLCKNRAEAASLFNQYSMIGSAFCADGLQYRKYKYECSFSTRTSADTSPIAMEFLSSDDINPSASDAKEKLHSDERRYQEIVQQLQPLQRNLTQFEAELKRMQRTGEELERAVRVAQNEVESVELDMRQDEPANLDSIQQAIRETELERQNIISQFTTLEERRTEIDNEVKPLLAEQESLKEQMAKYEIRIADLQTHLGDLAAKRAQAQSNRNHYEIRLQEENKKITDLRGVLQASEQELTNWTAQVTEKYNRIEKARKTETIEKEIHGIERALKERAARGGASVDEMAIELTRTKATLDQAKKDLSDMEKLQKSLRQALYARQDKWHTFRRHIAIRAKLGFQKYLNKRGYFGKLDFNHAVNTLELKVQTEDAVGTQRAREKDPKSLSGGEKSFSTICLLLSLWEAISCPIRCLDEFDVFMDAVNRRISMSMLTSTAKEMAGVQYVLITPQDMSSIKLGPEVRVHRMNDPERGQGQLNFH